MYLRASSSCLTISIALVNLTISIACRTKIPLTVIQVEDGLTFLHLFTKILAGYHPKLNVDDELAHSTVEKIMISQSKESFSVVDERLCLDDVCS